MRAGTTEGKNAARQKSQWDSNTGIVNLTWNRDSMRGFLHAGTIKGSMGEYDAY